MRSYIFDEIETVRPNNQNLRCQDEDNICQPCDIENVGEGWPEQLICGFDDEENIIEEDTEENREVKVKKIPGMPTQEEINEHYGQRTGSIQKLVQVLRNGTGQEFITQSNH